MRFRLLAVSLGSLILGAALFYGTKGWAQDADEDNPPPPPAAESEPPPPETQEGVEVLARGPVHEAFAEPTIRSPRATPVVSKRPPEPIPELPPDQKPDLEGVLWIPGYWAWDEDRTDYIWVSGIWRVPPPNRQWVPGYWNEVEGGWQWVPGFWANQDQAEAEYYPPPPDPVTEAPPPAPNDNSFFVPGCWVFRDTRYLWRPGYWVDYQPGWVWIPSHYEWSPAGFLYVDGYWDYPLQDRGLLFAPVVVDNTYWNRPNWSYRPAYAVYDQFLVGALFVRLSWNHYYFGDYFDKRYEGQGFVPWVDFRVGRRYYDPLFTFYRWDHRQDPRWAEDLQGLYVGRREGKIPAPPHTLVQQRTVVQNFRNTTVNNTTVNVQNVTVLAPLNQVSRTIVKMQPVPRSQMEELQRHVTQVHQVVQERRTLDTRVRTDHPRSAEGAPPVRAALPAVRLTAQRPEGNRTAPAGPTVPQAKDRPLPERSTERNPEERSRTSPPSRTERLNNGTNTPPPRVETPRTPRETTPRPRPAEEQPRTTPREETPRTPGTTREERSRTPPPATREELPRTPTTRESRPLTPAPREERSRPPMPKERTPVPPSPPARERTPEARPAPPPRPEPRVEPAPRTPPTPERPAPKNSTQRKEPPKKD
ncbi:MAG: YXWGXW repeat-containing protein [Planctomycetes bacterium]|nr:YXWGXW repeat-containing protein [Planctomycetota bacterium]